MPPIRPVSGARVVALTRCSLPLNHTVPTTGHITDEHVWCDWARSEAADPCHQEHRQDHKGHEDGCRIQDEECASGCRAVKRHCRAFHPPVRRLPRYRLWAAGRVSSHVPEPFRPLAARSPAAYTPPRAALPAGITAPRTVTVAITSDRGLCGGLNSNISKYTRALLSLNAAEAGR